MPKAKAAKIADAANLIVGGYAIMKHELGFRIVNLNSGNALIVSNDYNVLETSMEDLEVEVAIGYLKTNRSFMEA